MPFAHTLYYHLRERYIAGDKKKQVSYDSAQVRKEDRMSPVTIDTKALIKDYLQALSGQPKTEELMDEYISDASLKEHIRQAEGAFPRYEVLAQEMVAEGDLVAARCTFQGTHQGEFAGIPATGRQISSDFMIFYRVAEGKIAEHWMQLNLPDIISKLTN